MKVVNWKLIHSNLIKFPYYTIKNNAKFVDTFFGEPITHKSNIFSLELYHALGTTCI